MQIHSTRVIPAPGSFAYSRSANGGDVPVADIPQYNFCPIRRGVKAVEQITEADMVEMLGEPVLDTTTVVALPRHWRDI